MPSRPDRRSAAATLPLVTASLTAGNVFTLLLAGEDTTSHSMAWTIWSLAQRPEVQARSAQGGGPGPRRADLRDRVRDDRRPRLRRGGAARVDAADAGRPGHRTRAAHRHRDRRRPHPGRHPPAAAPPPGGLRDVERAADFQPRPLAAARTASSRPTRKPFLTFGAGPRFCPGRNLAFLEAKTALSMIARNFEIELDRTRRARHGATDFTMIPKGLRVRLRKRAARPHSAPPPRSHNRAHVAVDIADVV